MIVRQGSVEEAFAVSLEIEEFEDPHDIDEFRTRLTGANDLCLVAVEGGAPLDFKAGDENERGMLYSWMGGGLDAKSYPVFSPPVMASVTID